MTKFIERAKEQFETFGKVIITTYNDRTYDQNVYAGEEDIHVSNESSL